MIWLPNAVSSLRCPVLLNQAWDTYNNQSVQPEGIVVGFLFSVHSLACEEVIDVGVHSGIYDKDGDMTVNSIQSLVYALGPNSSAVRNKKIIQLALKTLCRQKAAAENHAARGLSSNDDAEAPTEGDLEEENHQKDAEEALEAARQEKEKAKEKARLKAENDARRLAVREMRRSHFSLAIF